MEALGMIEVVGLAAGIEAADVACKSANVELVGYELAKGGGYVSIKVLGQVGAVNAAVDAAAQAAGRITRVVSKLVIARPGEQLDPMVHSKATVGYTPPAPPKSAPAKVAADGATSTEPARTSTPAKETAKAPAEAPASTAKTTVERK